MQYCWHVEGVLPSRHGRNYPCECGMRKLNGSDELSTLPGTYQHSWREFQTGKKGFQQLFYPCHHFVSQTRQLCRRSCGVRSKCGGLAQPRLARAAASLTWSLCLGQRSNTSARGGAGLTPAEGALLPTWRGCSSHGLHEAQNSAWPGDAVFWAAGSTAGHVPSFAALLQRHSQ